MFRTRASLSGLTQWFLSVGILLLLTLGFVFWLAFFDRGFHNAYQILLSMDPPWDRPDELRPAPIGEHPWSWAASLIGWAATPAIIGGAAGFIISRRIEGYTHTVEPEIFLRRRTLLGDALSFPPLIPWIKKWPRQNGGAPTDAIATNWLNTRRAFVDVLVHTAHAGDWRTAQNHWELTVAAFLNSREYSEMGRQRKLSSSTAAALMLLVITGTGTCFICEVRKDLSP